MARDRNQSMNGAQMMVGMQELQDVLNALDGYVTMKDTVSLSVMVKHYKDPANPLRKLINQYNASIELMATPIDGEA